MPSPLAISNIILSQSDQDTSDATPKVSFYRDVLQPNPVPVLLRVRRARIFIFSTVVTAGIVAVTYVLSTGVTIATFPASRYDSQVQRDDLIQDYNAYVGSVAALAIKPLQLLTATVLPVWFWSFWTESAMAAESKRAFVPRVVVFLSTMGLVWMLSNAFYGINVQLARAPGHADSPAPTSMLYDSATSSGTNSSIPALDSILRSAITMDYRPAQSQCALASTKKTISTIEYAFPSRPWMESMGGRLRNLSTVADARLGQRPANEPQAVDVKTARSLASLSFPLIQAFFQSSYDQNAQSVDLSALTNSSSDTNQGWRVLSRDVNTTFHAFVETSSSARIKWFDTPNVVFSFESANLSSSFSFDSVSFEIPLRAEYMQRRLTLSNDTTSSVSYDNVLRGNATSTPTYWFDINIKDECGERACIVSPRRESDTSAAADHGAQVRALPICMDADGKEDLVATVNRSSTQACGRLSSTSFLVFSLAQRVEGEALSQTSSNVVRLKNARKIYSVTVGRLSWTKTELSSSCRDEVSPCSGVSFPLEANDAITASEAVLPLGDLKTSSNTAASWMTLAGTIAQEVDSGGALRNDVIVPRAFKTTSPLAVKPNQCDAGRGKLLATIEANHWYADRSQEQAYTAALFWLFRDGAVVKNETNASNPESTSGDRGMEGSIQLIITIPRISAIITYSGCAIVFLLSVTILLFSKRHESRIEKHYQPFHLAQTLVGTSSPFVPSPALVNSDLLNIGGDLLSSSEPLSEFEIMSLTLRHRRATSTFLQVPKPPSLSTSMSSSASRSLDGIV